MKRAFTLVELTLVLLVLGLLTHLAVAEFGRVRDRKMRESANRLLESVREAVWSERAGGEIVGFLADMGRLPRITGEGFDGSLEELWARPADVPSYAMRPATGTNLCVAASQKALLEEPGVLVPTGWRGPYLRIPFGRDELLDPWGNPMTAVDDAGLRRLVVSNGFVTAVSHYGPSGQSRDRAMLSVLPSGGATSRLVVNIVSASAASGRVTCKWFGPASGMVTGAVETVDYPGMVVFDGLTPGLRVFRDSVTGATRLVKIRPGDTPLEIVVP